MARYLSNYLTVCYRGFKASVFVIPSSSHAICEGQDLELFFSTPLLETYYVQLLLKMIQ
jgi:hypothetical protein